MCTPCMYASILNSIICCWHADKYQCKGEAIRSGSLPDDASALSRRVQTINNATALTERCCTELGLPKPPRPHLSELCL